MFTTLNLLKEHAACVPRYQHLCKALGGVKQYGRDTPISFERLIEMNGLDDTLWALQAVPYDQRKERDLIARLFAAGCAEHVLPIYEQQYPDDKRVRLCIEASRRFAYGEISREELAAYDAARASAYAAAEQDWQKAFFLSLLENPPVQEATA